MEGYAERAFGVAISGRALCLLARAPVKLFESLVRKQFLFLGS